MLFKTEKADPEFWNFIKENWILGGGLITQSIAAKLLGKTHGRINQMITQGKLTVYEYQNLRFLSFQQIMQLANDYVYTEMQNQIKLDLKKIPEEYLEQVKGLTDTLLATLEEQKNKTNGPDQEQ